MVVSMCTFEYVCKKFGRLKPEHSWIKRSTRFNIKHQNQSNKTNKSFFASCYRLYNCQASTVFLRISLSVEQTMVNKKNSAIELGRKGNIKTVCEHRRGTWKQTTWKKMEATFR
jgi:hypothetical protein